MPSVYRQAVAELEIKHEENKHQVTPQVHQNQPESSSASRSRSSMGSNAIIQAKLESTIGAAFFSQVLALDAATVKLDIWDTAGQERYHSLAPMYYRGAAAAIVVFDITREVGDLNSDATWKSTPGDGISRQQARFRRKEAGRNTAGRLVKLRPNRPAGIVLRNGQHGGTAGVAHAAPAESMCRHQA
ncbi:hypothetical protein PR202_gb28277 [Eleusine coracana subsp. coracana]|uniref:Uncharacterized protein n=1 Tax=Eleusine coracana subsp. coracana TaxID=191504 RepID=A0AAV5FVY6_ELECO|nr:hypothetical protein PR202_gb28277 [Eleusine coracana subsp. coracana]